MPLRKHLISGCFVGDIVGEKMAVRDPNEDARIRRELALMRCNIKRAERKIEALRKDCADQGHVVFNNNGVAQCSVCDEVLGWYCVSNLTRVCEPVTNEDGEEYCCHCWQPYNKR